ncbi:MAG: FtsQ-type POTRA domain-containing protein [Proteobacteria bacterium]|nr:FtsQ-type POTRA domain-containing protein [Pseudomonadota bacterium]
MTFPHQRLGQVPGRRGRRNRRRTDPPWRRLSELVGSATRAGNWARRSLPVFIIAGATVVLVAGSCLGYRLLTTSPRFSVRSIEVLGNRVLSDEQVRALAQVAPGDNIFRIELGDVIQALERTPWIARAEVSRALPATLVVEIEEHQPRALVELGGLYLADASGQVFKRAAIERGEGEQLTLITGLSREDYIERPGQVEKAIRDALAVATLYSAHPTRPRLGEIHIHPRHGTILLTYESALALRLGHGEKAVLDRRLRAFDTIWRALTPGERRRTRAIYADGSNRPDRVTVAFEGIE